MSEVMKLENAIADMKRQLRAESKSYLIKSWIGLYAQVIQQVKEIERLNEIIKSNKPNTEASAPVNEGEVK